MATGERRRSLSPEVIKLIAWDVRDGRADPDEAKRLMGLFRDLVRDQNKVPMDLLEYVADAFDSYLGGTRTIDAALGLARGRRGRRSASAEKGAQLAADVIRLRIAGITHQKALEEVSEHRHTAQSVVGKAFSDYKLSGLAIVRNERDRGTYPWTAKELDRLTELLSKDEWHLDALALTTGQESGSSTTRNSRKKRA